MPQKILYVFLLELITISAFCQKIGISKDTIDIRVNGRRGPAIVYHDRFYCFFSKDNDIFDNNSERLMIISRDGKVLNEIEAPAGIRIYYDFFVRNDSLLLLDYYNHDTYYLADDEHFAEVRRTDDLIYQDEDYYITSIDHGEWGGRTWFTDKHTGQQYEISLSNPIIHKNGNRYILTTGRYLFATDHPDQLKTCFSPRDYQTAFLTDTIIYSPAILQGLSTIYADTNVSRDVKFRFITSALINQQLYHLCAVGDSCFLATLEQGRLKPVYTFDKGLSPFRMFYHDRNRIGTNQSQSVQYDTDNEQFFGILEFDDQRVVQTCFHNLYIMDIFGTDSSKRNFVHTFDYYQQPGVLQINEADSLEYALKAEVISPGRYSSASPFDQRELRTRIYRKIEDSCLQMLTRYAYIADGGAIVSISFEWKEHLRFEKELYNPIAESRSQAMLAERMIWLADELTAKYGSCLKDIQGENFRQIIWENEKQRLILEGGFYDSPSFYNHLSLGIYFK